MLKIKEKVNSELKLPLTNNELVYTFTLSFPICCFILSKLSFVFAMWGIVVGLFVLAADLFIIGALYLILKTLVLKKIRKGI